MKFDTNTIILLALAAFIFMKKEPPKEALLTAETIAKIAAAIKAIATLTAKVADLQARVGQLHDIKLTGLVDADELGAELGYFDGI